VSDGLNLQRISELEMAGFGLVLVVLEFCSVFKIGSLLFDDLPNTPISFRQTTSKLHPGDHILKSSILQLSYPTTIMLRTGCLQNRPHRSLKKYRTYRPVPRQCIRPRYDTKRPNGTTTTTSEEKSALP
jgi:hypothetical protein